MNAIFLAALLNPKKRNYPFACVMKKTPMRILSPIQN